MIARARETDDLLEMPPHNAEAERRALGSMLLDNDCIDDVLAICSGADFFGGAHARLFEAIREVHSAGVPVNSVAVAEHLMARGQYDRLGGDDFLAETLAATPSAVDAAYYAGIVREKAIMRRLIEASGAAERDARSGMLTADQALAAAEARLADVADGRTSDGAVPLSVVLPEAMGRIRAREAGEVAGVPTGLADLDTPMGGGLADGELVILAARPSMGKTALAMHIAANAAVERRTPTAFYSMEMSRRELGERLYCSRAGLASDLLKRPWLMADEHWRALDRASAAMADAPLYIDERRGWDVGSLSADARRLRRRHGLGLVVVDYLQLMEAEPGMDRGVSRQEQVARLSRRLKILAGNLGVPVLALSQLNRKAEDREDRRPRMSDLRESGALEQDADVVLLIHRPERYDPNDKPGVAEVQIAKQRNGPAGEWVELAFAQPTGRFSDYEQPPATNF